MTEMIPITGMNRASTPWIRSIPPGFWRGAVSFLIVALIWEVTARYIVASPLFFVSLTDVGAKFVELWRSGDLQTHIRVSFIEFAVGYGLAIVVGIGGGVFLAGSRAMRGYFDPLLSMLYAMPIIALAPLFILWMGIGLASKVAVVFLTAVFPILINTVSGLTTTDQNLVDVARSLGATRGQIYMRVRMPSAIPFIIAGLRLSVARALVGVVAAELFGSRAGVGFMIITASQVFDTATVFVGVLILAITGVVAVETLKWLEQRLAPWRQEVA